MTDEPQGPEKEDREETEDRRTYSVVCTLCGEDAEVPFRPKKDQEVFCAHCYKFKRTSVKKKRERSSPRKKHGTRVTFPIECALCGNEEVLDYVPKGVPLSEVLCSECVRRTHGDVSRWSEIKSSKEVEAQKEWEIVCATCGRTDYLHFPPDPDEDYFCVRCYNEQATPSPERLKGKKRVGRAVYIRNKESEE